MRRVDVVTIGSAVKDVTFYSDEISIIKNPKDIRRQTLMAVEYGAKVELDHVYVNYGGGALNVGLGLKNFGLTVAPLIKLGKDWVGREVIAFMHSHGLNTSLVTFDREYPTGFSVIITAANDRDHTIFTYKGATTRLTLPPHFTGLKTSWFYVSPLSMADWSSEMQKIIDYVSIHPRVRVAWTPGGKQLKTYKKFKKFLPQIEVLILNKDEAIETAINIFGRHLIKRKINQPRYLLDQLKKLGIKNLVITAGAKGVYGLDGQNKYYFKPAVAKKIIDTVGAGDAFASGFLAAFHRYNDFERALILGNRNSGSVLSRVGAQNGLLQIQLK